MIGPLGGRTTPAGADDDGHSRRTVSADGVVAVLFTDLVGSTELLSRLGDDQAEALRQTHFGLLREAIGQTDGEEVKNLGDGLMVVFTSPSKALTCGLAMQQAVQQHSRDRPSPKAAIRIGIHAGEPHRHDQDFFGTCVVVAKRLCDAAQGGQILASEVVATLAGSGRFRFRPAGRLALKGLPQPVPAVTVESASEPMTAPRPRRSRPLTARPRGPRIVGRDDELRLLERELQRAGSEFRCLLLVGEPGVGKTRLAHELIARHGRRIVALTARAFPMGRTLPFGLWAEALERHLRELPADEISSLCGGFLDDLAGVVRSVAAVRGAPSGAEAPRSRLLEGLAVVLGNLAAGDPVVVVLDDIHLADASSWEALGYLARDLASSRILVVATARPEELAELPLANQVLLGLESDGLLERLAVRPLPADAIAGLAAAVLDEPPPGPLVDWLTARSGGNPLFAVGLLRALLAEGADLSAPQLAAVPEALAERVASRLQAFDDRARRILEVLALLGRPVELADLMRFTGATLEEIDGTLTRLVRSRMVVEDDVGVALRYEISHPLVSETIYDQMGGVRRRVLHRNAGRKLLAAGRAAEAAPHFARCADTGDPEAVEALCAALAQAEQQEAYREALTILGALVDIVPEDDPRWLSIADAMAGPVDWVLEHRADPAAATAERALRIIDRHLDPSPDVERRASSKLRLAHFLAFGAGDLPAAAAAGRAALALFDSAGDHARRLMAAVELAWIEGLEGDFAGMEDAALAVIAAAERDGSVPAALRGWGALGMARMTRGRFDDGRHWRRMADLAEQIGSPYYRLLALANLATSHALEGRPQDAAILVSDTKTNQPLYRTTIVLEAETLVHWVAGNFTAARASAREAEQWTGGDISRRRAMGTIYAALSALEQDDVPEARRLVDKLARIYGAGRWHAFSDGATWAAGMLAVGEGRSDAGLRDVWRAATELTRLEAWPFAAFVWADVAEVGGELGRGQAAAAAAEALETIAASIDLPLYQGLGAFAAGWSALTAGRTAMAVEHAEAATDWLSRTSCAVLRGRALHLASRAGRGDSATGSGRAAEAAAIFRAAGAHRRADRALAVVSEEIPRRSIAAAALSRRERDVARLAAEGLSARDIAERLYIGERTVETHLSRIYVKLGVATKLELVRRAGELGI